MWKILASPYTRIFWNEWKLDQNTSNYNIAFNQEFSGNIDIIRLNKAVNRFVSEHILLNSHIAEVEGELYWLKNDRILNLEYFTHNLSSKDVSLLLQEPFHIEKGPLYRFVLIKNKRNKYYLVIVLHHLLIDGSKVKHFYDELSRYYNNSLYKNIITIDEQIYKISNLSKELLDYVELNRTKSRLFWEAQLSSIESLDLRFLSKNKVINFKSKEEQFSKIRTAEIKFTFSKIVIDKLRKLKTTLGSPYFYGRNIYALLINKYTSQEKFCISYPIAIKGGIDFIYGGQVNTTLIPYDFSKINNFFDLTAQSKQFIDSLKSEEVNHSYLPIFELLSLNQSLLSLPFSQTTLRNINFEFDGIKTSTPINTNIDLVGELLFEQEVKDEVINYIVRYKIDRLDKAFVETFVNSYKKLFLEILEEQGNKDISKINNIKDYCLFSDKQYKQIICDWNKTYNDYPSARTIHELFEEQAKKTPDYIAIIYEDISLTYRALDIKANQLANYLLKTYDIKSGDLIGVCLDRGEFLLISILAVLKAGGAYVPIDPNNPDERIEYILADTCSKVVLTNKIYNKKLERLLSKKKIVPIDNIDLQQIINMQATVNNCSAINNNSLAYVMYTSGTTGVPKGVMVEHKTVINLLFQSNLKNQFQHSKHGTLWTNINFDVSVYEIFTILLNGCTLHIISEEVRGDAFKFFDYLEHKKINYAYIPPYFLNENNKNRKFLLNFVLLGVDKIRFKDVEYILRNSNSVKILNGYGPTEATVFCCSYIYNMKDKFLLENLPIGNPISNAKCYVLNQNLNPLPIGAIGELYIGGEILSRGYLNNPKFNSERFLPNPFQTEEEKKDFSYGIKGRNAEIYRTGDLVRWLPDANIEYIGRNDFQVKIRGYRIELEEIENALSNYEGIIQSVVINKEHRDNKYVVGYYVSDNKLDEDKIFKYLYSKLPQYMIPSILVNIKKLPLTVNGKLNRKALPEPEFISRGAYIAPRNEVEGKVVNIWSEVICLPKDQIGINYDFFSLGGNSILIIRLVSKLNKEFNTNINASDIFSNGTVEKLSYYLMTAAKNYTLINKYQINKVEEWYLSFAQERLWFIDQYEEGTNAYNIPLIFQLFNNTKVDILENSIRSIVDRHEILRTLIKKDHEGRSYQLVLNNEEQQLEILTIEIINQSHLNQELNKEINHVYDLSNECPIRVRLYKFVNPDLKSNPLYYISIVIHHIAFDGWSSDVFLIELQTYYNYYLNRLGSLETSLDLPALSIQYKDFALWQRNYLSDTVLEKQLTYWKSKLRDFETLNLVTDRSRPARLNYKGEDVFFELNEQLSNNLRILAKELKVSLYTILLSGYCLMLRVYSNQDDIIIGMPLANRHYAQVEHLIGCFINSLPLRIKIDSELLIKDFIKQVGMEIIEAQAHQDLPFEKLVEELKIPKDSSMHPVFQVMFGAQVFNKSTCSNNLWESYKAATDLYKVAKFDISTHIDDSGKKLKGIFNYATSLYTNNTINSFKDTYIIILEQFAKLSNINHQIRINSLAYLTEQQHNIIVSQSNEVYRTYEYNKTIHELFEEQVIKTPDNLALIHKESTYTYKQLNEKANKLAHYLRKIVNITPDTLILLCLDRSEYIIIAILGILKSGAAYVPIDPSYPDERIKYQLEDTNTKLILTNILHKVRLQSIFKDKQLSILAIEEDVTQEQLTTQPDVNLCTITTDVNLAYVIYTSGTTGKPKGVMIEHKAYISLIYSIKNRHFSGKKKLCTYSITNYVFDIFGLEYGLPLLSGGLIVIGNNNFDFLDCMKFDFIQMTPSLCELKLNSLMHASHCKLLIGGENLSLSLLTKILNKSIDVINVYGPTETTIWSTSKFYSYKKNIDSLSVTLGNPLDNESIYVLDTNLNPLPVGAVGELYIGGIGLARGYLNHPRLTKERFILNPFLLKKEGFIYKHGLLYKTGDLVRLLPNDELQYMGRNDFQVKIKGYRIELEEVENVLSKYEGIKQSIVLVRDNKLSENSINSKQLVGYYVSDNKLNEEEILNYLLDTLPTYAVPEVLVHIQKMLLTINGKIDRNALLEIPIQSHTIENHYNISTNSKLEVFFVSLWAKVLRKEIINIHDTFFDLGGHSLILVSMHSQLPNHIKEKLTIAHLFKYTTIAKICNFLAKADI